MKVINKNSKTIYKYSKHDFSDGVITAIILYAIAILLFIVSIVISYIFIGEAPLIVAGVGVSSIIFDIGSMIYVILDIYLYKNFHIEIRNLLILQILFLILWIFIT